MHASGGPFERTLQRLARIGARPPIGSLLDSTRRDVVERVLSVHKSRAAVLGPRLENGDQAARAELDELAERALSDMRGQVERRARDASFTGGGAALVDSWWRATRAEEYLDDPRVALSLRLRILSSLDGLNALLGNYREFFERLLPLLPSGRRARVLDLAAGHGGFVLCAATLAAEKNVSVDLVASDIKSEYLRLGQERARKGGVDVSFIVQDALDLSNIEPGEYDVVTCMQSLHHFRPGQIAIMFAEAVRIAASGVLFIDGARSALNAAATVGLGLGVYRDRAFAHDALVSFRRFFVPEELELLARLAPGGEAASARWIPPGHCLLTLMR